MVNSVYHFKHLSKNAHAILYALIAVAMWSTVATAFNIALKELSYIQLLTFSTGVSFLVLSIVLFVSKKFVIVLHLAKNDLIYLIFKGLVNPFAYYLILFKAYSLLPANEAMILNYTWPIVLVLFSILFLKQHFKKIDFISIAFSFIGVIVIATKGNIFDVKFSNFLGIGLALGSSIVWAGYWILNMKKKIEPIVQLWFSFGVGFIASFSLFLLLNLSFDISLKSSCASIYVGLFEMSIPFILWQLALNSSSNTSIVSNLVFLSPFISLILISLVLKETILISSFVGFLMILSGIMIHFFFSKK